MAAPSRIHCTHQGAATLSLAASSVASVAFAYERSERLCDAGVSRLTRTMLTRGDR
jgi:hypothetical protein